MNVEVGDIVQYYFERQKFPRNQGVAQHEGQGEVLEIYSKASPHVEDQFLVQSQGVSNDQHVVFRSEILSVVSEG